MKNALGIVFSQRPVCDAPRGRWRTKIDLQRVEAKSITLFCAAVLAWLAAPPFAAAVNLNGSVQYETFGYPDADTHGERWENFFTATLRSRGSLGGDITYEWEGRAVADDAGFTAGAYSLRNADRRRPYLSLINAVLHYRPSPDLRISVGKQIVNWSVMDGLEPANLMNPLDESDPFRRVQLGVPGIAVHYEHGDTSAELTVVPLAFNPSRTAQGRWSIVPSGVRQGQDLPPVQPDETQAGARVGTRFGTLEANVVGYVGRDTEAIFVPHLIPVDSEQLFELEIVQRYPHLRAGGITLSRPLGELAVVRSEAVYFNSPDRDRDDFLYSVASLEYAPGTWRAVLGYLRNDLVVRAPQEVTDQGERSFVRSLIFGELRYDAGGPLLARVRAGYDTAEEFSIFQPEVSYRVWRKLRIALAGEIINSSRGSYFYRVRHEDRFSTRLELPFTWSLSEP